jgi:hypothetical protein
MRFRSATAFSPAARGRVEGVGQPVEGQVEPAVEADQLGQRRPLGFQEGPG